MELWVWDRLLTYFEVRTGKERVWAWRRITRSYPVIPTLGTIFKALVSILLERHIL